MVPRLDPAPTHENAGGIKSVNPFSRAMSRIHVGTSGWTYDDWTGPFYPEDVKGAERLSFYAERFDTVEVNATFYRLPFQGMITGMASSSLAEHQ